MQMYCIFGEDTPTPPKSAVKPRAPRNQLKKRVEKGDQSLANEDLLMILFPQDFTDQQHISKLMNASDIAWCEEDVRYFQWRMLKDVADILSRTNSSLSKVDETLMWVFNTDSDYDFDISQCAARVDKSVEFFQRQFVCILAATLRTLRRKKKVPENKVIFYRKCLMKANKLLGEHVNLTPTEMSYIY